MRAGDQIFMRQVVLAAVGTLALGLAACDPKSGADKAADSPAVQKPQAGGVGQTVDDLALNIKVEDALKEKQELKSLAIKVSTAGGVVTLSGTADTAANRELAETIVMNVNGVKSVHNKLAVAING